jgi:hypothetical protein
MTLVAGQGLGRDGGLRFGGMQRGERSEQQDGEEQGFHLSSHGLANTTGTGAPLTVEVVL